VLDKYLGRTGYGSQQTCEPEDPGRPDNLWEPVDSSADRGAHGRFDDRAHPFSYQLWFDLKRSWILALGALGMLVASGAMMIRSHSAVKRRL
jgi:hypothetical protein